MRRVFDDWEEDRADDPSNPAAAVARAERAFVHQAAEVIYTDATIAKVCSAYAAARDGTASREAARDEGISLYNPYRGLTTAYLAGDDTMILPLGKVLTLRRRSARQQARLALRAERGADGLKGAVSRRAKREPIWALTKRDLLKADQGALIADMKTLAITEGGRQAISDMIGALTRGAKKAQAETQRRAA